MDNDKKEKNDGGSHAMISMLDGQQRAGSSSVGNAVTRIHQNPPSIQSDHHHNQRQPQDVAQGVPSINSSSSSATTTTSQQQILSNHSCSTQLLQQSTHLPSSNSQQLSHSLPSNPPPFQLLGYQQQGPRNSSFSQPVPQSPGVFSQLGDRSLADRGLPTSHVQAVSSAQSQRGVNQPSTNQPSPRFPGASYQMGRRPPHGALPTTPVQFVSQQSSQTRIPIFLPSVNLSGLLSKITALLEDNLQLRLLVGRLEADIANVKSQLSAILKPSGGEQSTAKRARSEKPLPPSQDRRPNPLHPRQRSSLKDDEIQGGRGESASSTTEIPRGEFARRFTNAFPNSGNPSESSSSNPSLQSTSIPTQRRQNTSVGSRSLGLYSQSPAFPNSGNPSESSSSNPSLQSTIIPTQRRQNASVGSHSMGLCSQSHVNVFGQGSREVTSLNEPRAEAERAQDENA